MLTDRQFFFLLSACRRSVDVPEGLITILLPLPDLGRFVGIAHGSYSVAMRHWLQCHLMVVSDKSLIKFAQRTEI